MNRKVYAIEIGKRLREIRNKLRMNQTDFGDLLGYTQKTISDFEHGKTLLPTDAAVKICDTLNLDMNYFLRGSDSEREPHHLFHEDTGYASIIDLYQICPEEDRPLCVNVMQDIVSHSLQQHKIEPQK